MDLVMKVAELPSPGQTVLGGTYMQISGGKGANQAVAAKRLGGNVFLHAAVGVDGYGDALLMQYAADGIDCTNVIRDVANPTGTALIIVDGNGENLIAVASGANTKVKPPTTPIKASAFLLQGEIHPETILKTIEIAFDATIPVIFNNAPILDIPFEYRTRIRYLVVNEHEAGMMIGKQIDTRSQALSALAILREQGYPCVVITLGANGVVWSSGDTHGYQPAFLVNPLDTTAAGDTFCGAFTTRIVAGDSLESAIQFSSAAAALSTLKVGAQSSIPYLSEVLEYLNSEPPKHS